MVGVYIGQGAHGAVRAVESRIFGGAGLVCWVWVVVTCFTQINQTFGGQCGRSGLCGRGGQ